MLAADRAQPVRELRGELQVVVAAAEPLHGGAGAVGGKLQQIRRALHPLRPPLQLRPQRLRRAVLALPGGVVGVLDGERLQWRGPARGKGAVQLGQLAEQHAE
jgi:hypothetical protein